ncbi:MAG: LPS export ABC transporter permease LptF [Micavibrio aeruginosavorus]|uniref:LPS export ABC transporter permease LptF n=1 Tax=Micavibrio aeruginosavorus TaxID=349221 RepID=A0A2W5PKV2_9BACT|nr:MAG: LPS export ABC transporter permease LptF [Micavibrio aeruginosavorus]
MSLKTRGILKGYFRAANGHHGIFMVYDRYLLKNVLWATLFTALSLAAVIMLTQSLRFLELIINSGASSFSFLILTFLAMPRFFEVILPIALMIGTVFIYNRMSSDSEMVVMKSSGYSPLRLSRPALMLAAIITLVVFVITAWIAPLSLSKMQTMRVTIKAQYSALLLRDGIFNAIGKDLTVYVHHRADDGALEGLLIHDSRDPTTPPVTILAKRGVIVSDEEGQQVVVYNGSRQDYNPKTGALNRLDFERYSLDLPEAGPVRQRWREPDERTLGELLFPDKQAVDTDKKKREFRIEAHRRFVSPFLAVTFTLVSLCSLMLGFVDRRGLAWRIVIASGSVVVLQGLYLVAYNLAKESIAGLVMMYALVFVPLIVCFYLLSPMSDGTRLRARQWIKGLG